MTIVLPAGSVLDMFCEACPGHVLRGVPGQGLIIKFAGRALGLNFRSMQGLVCTVVNYDD